MPLSMNRAAWMRALPFLSFMVLLALRGAAQQFGVAGIDPQWLYGLTVALVGAMLLWWRREYGELARQLRPSLHEAAWAVCVGLAVFGLWIRLDAPWMSFGEPSASFRPVDAQGQLQWALVAVRLAGAALLVPVMEELFWRSFLMRWVQDVRFEAVPPQHVGLRAVVLSTFVFMLAHTLWLAAIIAGLAYAWLYVRSGKLWLPVIAHAVTNGALGVWVVATGNWQFW